MIMLGINGAFLDSNPMSIMSSSTKQGPGRYELSYRKRMRWPARHEIRIHYYYSLYPPRLAHAKYHTLKGVAVRYRVIAKTNYRSRSVVMIIVIP